MATCTNPVSQAGKQKKMRTALYRHFDADGGLLYVGISLSAVDRLSSHGRDAGWADKIAHVTVEWHPTRKDATAAEEAAIKAECPAHNINHNEAVRFGPARSIRRVPPPHIPQYVRRAEFVAAALGVSLISVNKLIAQGMPRKQLSPRRFEYDIGAIRVWLRMRAETAKAAAAEMAATRKVEDDAATFKLMQHAISKIGQRRTI